MAELSIIVASINTQRTIQESLDALVNQNLNDEIEIFVIDSSTDSSAEIAGRFEQITLIQKEPGYLVPELWKMGIDLAGGQLVAFTTANFIPASNWVSELRTFLHSDHAAIGGVFEKLVPDAISQWAIYFLRYSAYLPSALSRPVSQVASDNAVYQHWVFEKYGKLIEHGFWEHPVNRELVADGYSLLLTPELKVSMGYFSLPTEFFLQRFLHGRAFGAERALRLSPAKRLIYIFVSPFIPVILLTRVSLQVMKSKSQLVKFFFSMPWILFYISGWSLGELSGYLFGVPDKKKMEPEDTFSA